MPASSLTDPIVWRRTVITTTAAGLIAPAFQMWFDRSWTWTEIGRSTLFSLVYSNSVGFLATLVFVALESRISRLRTVPGWTVIVLLLVFCAAAGCLVGSALIHASGLVPGLSFSSLYAYSFRLCLPICLGIGIFTGLVEEARDRLRTTELQLRTKELERERAEKLMMEARLSSLESRVQPHFLFNVLNSISSLVREDPAAAERLIERMASLLRFSLDANQSRLVSLERELKIVCDYLEIERARFGERLSYRIDVPEDLKQLQVPPMSLQTLVENSVKYAVAPRREGGRIEVSASNNGASVQLTVRDDGPGLTPDAIPAGHGIDLLQGRLGAAFGGEARLYFEGPAVTIELPMRQEASV